MYSDCDGPTIIFYTTFINSTNSLRFTAQAVPQYFNNDGYNDVFVPFENTNIPQASISIFDRWGYKVYENSGLLPGWDGNHNGNPCTDGTYYYVVSLEMDDQKFSFSGFVQVLR